MSIHEDSSWVDCPEHNVPSQKIITAGASFHLKQADRSVPWKEATTREIQRKVEASPEYQSGQIQPVGQRWV